jgi:hypothetical protein
MTCFAETAFFSYPFGEAALGIQRNHQNLPKLEAVSYRTPGGYKEMSSILADQ